ncbi:facilitated trehalose transporter Tret1-like [Diachasma alloeum]|uniref:facilitated trehalose transporter Tret1-like n=1 Tax=Diachasma alloeum TaxID=454923 RepID=UPI00073849F6|nr:facilitated trehalose transporter Tret1-like [Diachasma alloeum]
MIGFDICLSDRKRCRQTFAAIIANLSTVAAGMLSAWTSPITPQLTKESTPVGTTPMTDHEISSLSSVTGLASLIALLFYAFSAGKISNKILGWISAASATASWLLIYFAQNFYYLLIARSLAGVVCGLTFSMTPVYVSQIAEDSIRGQLGSLLSFGFNLGTLATAILGAQLSYHNFALCGTIVPLVFIVGFIPLPESPTHLLRKGLVDGAKRSLLWLRNNDTEEVDNELVQLQNHITSHSGKTSGLKELFRDRGTIRALIISVTLFAGQHTSGYAIMFTYTTAIFELAQTSVNPYTASIVIAVIQIIGSWISTLTIDRIGRRKLVLASCAGIMTSHCVFGIMYIFQNQKYDLASISWLPVVTISAYALVYSAGLGPSTSVVSSEIFSPDIVGLGLSVALSTEFISNFCTTLAFPLVTAKFGIHVSFFILALFTGVTLAIIFFLLPETKGKSKLDIFEELNGTKKRTEHIAAILDENGIKQISLTER